MFRASDKDKYGNGVCWDGRIVVKGSNLLSWNYH